MYACVFIYCNLVNGVQCQIYTPVSPLFPNTTMCLHYRPNGRLWSKAGLMGNSSMINYLSLSHNLCLTSYLPCCVFLISEKEINQGNLIRLKFGCWQEEVIVTQKLGLPTERTEDTDLPTVTWSPTERREKKNYYYSSVFELTGQGLTVERGILVNSSSNKSRSEWKPTDVCTLRGKKTEAK